MAGTHLDPVLRQIRQLAGASGGADVTDAELLSRYVARQDQDAFAELVRRHASLVWRTCRRALGSADGAEDAFQATFVVLARKAASVHKPASLASWLHGVAFRVATRARTARRTEQIDATQEPTVAVGPEQEAAWRELQRLIVAEVDALPENLRLPILLHYWEGRTTEETARALGWATGTVKTRLVRARALLQRRLVKRGVTLDAGAILLLGATAGGAAPAVCVARAIEAGGTASGPLVAQLADAALTGSRVAQGKLVLGIGIAAAVLIAGALRMPATVPQFSAPAAHETAKQGLAHEKPALVDADGDPLPDGAVARLGTLRFNYGGEAAFFSADGKSLIAAGGGMVRLWDVATGKEQRQFASDFATIGTQSLLSPDGRSLTFFGLRDDKIGVVDLASGNELRRVTLPVPRRLVSVYQKNALSPDAALAAAHSSERVQVFDLATNKELCRLPHQGEQVRCLAFAGNDRLVSATKERVIEVWEARSGKKLHHFTHGDPVEEMIASPDGKVLATLGHHTYAIDRFLERDTIQLWDLTTSTRTHGLAARPGRWFMGARFSPDGRRVLAWSTSKKGFEVTLWDTATGERRHEFADAYGPVAVSADGRVMAASAQLFDLETGQRITRHEPRHSWTSDLFLSANAERAVVLGYSSITSWDATTGRRLATLEVEPYPYELPRRDHSPDGRYGLAFDGEPSQMRILMWDLPAQRLLWKSAPPGLNQGFTTAFAPDSSLLALWNPGKQALLRMLDPASGEELRAFKIEGEKYVSRLQFAGDGKTLFLVGREVTAVDAGNGKELFSWRMEPLPRQTGKASVGKDGQNVYHQPSPWRSLTISPAGPLAACILDGDHGSRIEDRIVVCDARTGKVLRRFSDSGKPDSSYEELLFSPDGRLLATQDGPIVHVWEVATGKEVCRLDGHRSSIRSLAFSQAGRHLATGSSDRTVLIWDLARVVEPYPDTIPAAWNDLAAADAKRGYAAIWRLANEPAQALPLLRRQLRPISAMEVREVNKLVQDLASDVYAVRATALERLLQLGAAAGPALRRAATKEASLEVKRRIDKLLEGIDHPALAGESLRLVRALAALECAATADAHSLLKELASGAPGAWLTDEAQAAWARSAALQRDGRAVLPAP